MKLLSIMSAIREKFPECVYRCGNEKCEVNAVILGTGRPELTQVVRLYAGTVPEHDPGTGVESCCLCLKSKMPAACNLIAAPDMETLEAVFNQIQVYLSKSQELAQLSQQVLTKRIDLQGIIDRGTEIMDNPVLVADPGYQILAMSDLELEDSAWKNFRKLRQIPYHPDMVREYEEFLQGIRRGKLVSVIDGKHKKGYFIRCAVMDGDMFIGQMHIFSEFHEFTAVDEELAGQLAGVVSIDIMHHVQGRESNGTTSDYLVSDLILGKLANPATIEARMKFVGWTLRKNKYLLLVQWDGDDKNINFRDACVANLVHIFPDGRSTVDGPNMVVMFSTWQELNIDSPEIAQIREQLARPGLLGVLSMPFEKMSDASYRYQQTWEILDLNKRLKREDAFVMAEASSFELLVSQASQKYRPIDYCHPLVRRLMEYDAEHGKDYLDTLRAYIIAGRSFTKAGELLHMHRNSVIYRMKQIEEILQFDFSKEEFVFHLELSFRILEYMRTETRGKWEKRTEEEQPPGGWPGHEGKTQKFF